MRDSELDDVRVCLEEELLAVEAAEKEPPSYAPERQRFYILAVLSLFSFCQCLNWFTFSSVDPQKVEDYYGAAVGGQARRTCSSPRTRSIASQRASPP